MNKITNENYPESHAILLEMAFDEILGEAIETAPIKHGWTRYQIVMNGEDSEIDCPSELRDTWMFSYDSSYNNGIDEWDKENIIFNRCKQVEKMMMVWECITDE